MKRTKCKTHGEACKPFCALEKNKFEKFKKIVMELENLKDEMFYKYLKHKIKKSKRLTEKQKLSAVVFLDSSIDLFTEFFILKV